MQEDKIKVIIALIDYYQNDGANWWIDGVSLKGLRRELWQDLQKQSTE